MKRISLLLSVLLAAAGCGSDSKDDPSCDPLKVDACGTGQVCERVQGGETVCADPVEVQGVVFDLATGSASGGILGARVVPLDVNGAPVGTAATTGPGGAYKVRVPAIRDAAGKPVAGAVTLRADAEGYATFPSGIRSAVPIDLSTAAAGNGVWTVDSTLTDVGLVDDPEAGTASLHGTVAGVSAVGALVVAEPTGVVGGVGRTGVADSSGSYAIFNLPAGSWTVKAYAKGLNHAAADAANLAENEDRALDLATRAVAPAVVTGSIQRTGQNQPTTLETSVILVVQSTYDLLLDRGESPPGLIVPDLTASSYSLAGVPDGTYVALAAFGNDGYVRDVSGIGGTDPIVVTVADGAMTSAPGGFKITGPVDLVGITPATGTEGAATLTNLLTPTFDWDDYSSAAEYEVIVFDALGTPVWTPGRFPSATTAVVYAGDALLPGMTYQVRISAFDTGGAQISRTEDLKGVFTYRP